MSEAPAAEPKAREQPAPPAKSQANLRPWKPGQSGNPLGRPKIEPRVRRYARKYDRKMCKVLAEIAQDTKLPAAERRRAAMDLIAGLGPPCRRPGDRRPRWRAAGPAGSLYMIPPRPKFVTYFRVSTQKQGRSGLGLKAQQDETRRFLFQTGGIELASFTEVESGKHADRPKLAAALVRCRQTRATLLVAKIDRLSRNVAFLFSLRDSGVKFQALDISDANTLNLGVMIVMAQHEREIISKRTKDALAARRAKGLPMGNPRDLSAYQAQASSLGCFANRAKAQARAQEIASAIEEARTAGCTSLRKIAAYLDTQGIQTPRGKAWTATAVRNALEHLKAA